MINTMTLEHMKRIIIKDLKGKFVYVFKFLTITHFDAQTVLTQLSRHQWNRNTSMEPIKLYQQFV